MANCANMEKGDVYFCKKCGLEMQVMKACRCGSGSGASCTVPLMCCNEEMTKK